MLKGEYRGCARPSRGKSLCLQNRGYYLYRTKLSLCHLRAVSLASTMIGGELALAWVIGHRGSKDGDGICQIRDLAVILGECRAVADIIESPRPPTYTTSRPPTPTQ